MSSAASVVVIDYGMGNLHSVSKALEHVSGQHNIVVSGDAAVIEKADRIVFPGVGAIRDCMAELQQLGLDSVVVEALRSKPTLAICVGMQALMTRSEENQGTDCLKVLPGQVLRFADAVNDADEKLKVPHMGWNQVEQLKSHPMWRGIDNLSRFYFVHSYYVHAEQRDLVVGGASYGAQIDAALAQDLLFAVQFHPEKSGDVGLQLLQNFLSW